MTSRRTCRSARTYSSYNALPCAIQVRADGLQDIRCLAATLPPIVLFPFFFFFLYLSVFLTILLVLLASSMTGLTAFRAVRLAWNLYRVDRAPMAPRCLSHRTYSRSQEPTDRCQTGHRFRMPTRSPLSFILSPTHFIPYVFLDHRDDHI